MVKLHLLDGGGTIDWWRMVEVADGGSAVALGEKGGDEVREKI